MTKHRFEILYFSACVQTERPTRHTFPIKAGQRLVGAAQEVRLVRQTSLSSLLGPPPATENHGRRAKCAPPDTSVAQIGVAVMEYALDNHGIKRI
jgi:hypothetical protein